MSYIHWNEGPIPPVTAGHWLVTAHDCAPIDDWRFHESLFNEPWLLGATIWVEVNPRPAVNISVFAEGDKMPEGEDLLWCLMPVPRFVTEHQPNR